MEIISYNCVNHYPDIPQVKGIDLRFPFIINKDSDYLKTIEGQFYDYVFLLLDPLLNNLPIEQEDKEIIWKDTNEAAKRILDAFESSVSGNHERAVNDIIFLLKKYRKIFIHKLGQSYGIKCNNFSWYPKELAKDVFFYRGRFIAKSTFQINKKELYHIPFNNRKAITSERFSVPGTPCLYLGDNTYICQNEIHRDKFQNVFYAVYKPSNSLLQKNVIDISIPDLFTDALNGYIYEKNRQRKLSLEERIQYLKYSPSYLLEMACRIQCDEENRSFKSEYVIPQLIMYCLQKLNCVGVVYESTCSGSHRVLQTCFAFPAFKKERKNSLYSKELLNSFAISDGFNYSQFLSKHYSDDYLKEDDAIRADYSKKNIGYFAKLYQGQDWAFYDGNLPYYKSDNYAFDQYLIEQLEKQK